MQELRQGEKKMIELPVPRVLGWHVLYQPGARARCIKDNPPMKGFGRSLQVGDVVNVDSVCWSDGGYYEIGVKEHCAFYKLEDYFEVQL